jgi:DNA-binding response OmpR family regulator
MIPPRKRILLIDPSPASLAWQLLILQEEQYDSITATAPMNGVRIALFDRPDLVVLDVPVCSADAVAAAKVLRTSAETQDIRLLGLISDVQGDGKLAELEAVCDALLVKPFERSQYLGKVRTLLG